MGEAECSSKTDQVGGGRNESMLSTVVIEPISVDQVGVEALSDLLWCGKYIVSCCGSGTMHLWQEYQEENETGNKHELSSCKT